MILLSKRNEPSLKKKAGDVPDRNMGFGSFYGVRKIKKNGFDSKLDDPWRMLFGGGARHKQCLRQEFLKVPY